MDKIIHDKLFNHSIPVAEDLWDRFEQKAFREKPKRRKFIYWIFPGILILFIIGFGIHHFTVNKSFSSNFYNETKLNVRTDSGTPSLLTTPKEISPPLLVTIKSEEPQKSVDADIRKLEDKSIHSNKLASKKQTASLLKSSPALNNDIADGNIFQRFYSDHPEAMDNKSYRSAINSIGQLELKSDFPSLVLASAPLEFIMPKRAECPKFSPIPPTILLEMYVSPDLVHKYLQSRSSEIMDKYKNERLESENPLISFSAGLRANWISGAGYGIKSGLDFAQINERFDYTDPNSTVSKTFITIDTIFHPNGTIEVYSDTSTITIKGETLYSIYNRFTSLNLPVLISYEWNFDKFSIGLAAGVELNLLFSQKGQMLDENLYAQEFTTGKPDAYRPFKDNLSVTYVANVGLYYPITKKLEASLEPHFRLNGASITRNNYPLTQKFATGGLRFGLRYRIGKKNI